MRVSVVMAAYNAEATIDSAVESVLRQTFDDFELVLVEDGSTDSTADRIARIAEGDARVRVVPNEQNLGLIRSLQRGLELARAPLVARMDADDLCHPDRFTLQVAHLDAHPEIGVVGSRYRLFSEDPAHARVDERHDGYYRAEGIRDGRTPIAHPTAMFRRELVDRFGSYDERWAHAEDHELWARWYSRGVRFAVLDQRLLDYRIHAGSVTASKARKVVATSFRVNLRTMLRDRVRFTPRGYAYVLKQAAYLAASPLVGRFVGRGRDQSSIGPA